MSSSINANRGFLRPDELISNDRLREIGTVEKLVEIIIFPFTWLAMIFTRRKPTMQEQLTQEIINQEHARISSLRHAAIMRADAARSEVMRNELAAIYEETVKAEAKMKFMLEELSKGTSLSDIENRIKNNTYHQTTGVSRIMSTNRFEPAAR